MQLRKWKELPKFMRTREVRKYYNIVNKRRASLMVKRLFDIVVASIMLAVLALPMLIIAILIKYDSRGPVFSDRKELHSMEEYLRYTSSGQWLLMLMSLVLL